MRVDVGWLTVSLNFTRQVKASQNPPLLHGQLLFGNLAQEFFGKEDEVLHEEANRCTRGFGKAFQASAFEAEVDRLVAFHSRRPFFNPSQRPTLKEKERFKKKKMIKHEAPKR